VAAAHELKIGNSQIGIVLFITITASIFVGGCFAPPRRASNIPAAFATPLTHTVQPGETIYHIAHSYGVEASRLMTANGIDDPRELRVGQTLIIPGRRREINVATGDSPETWPGPSNPRQLAWPVIGGMVSSPFGMRHGVMHNGVDLVAPAGTPVHAADNGFVIFAGHLHGYGNVIILQHSDGYITVYGHNRRNLVRQGESVARRQVIAEIGATGRASGPNLHFEVRYHNHPQNPLVFLSVPAPGNGVSFARGEGS